MARNSDPLKKTHTTASVARIALLYFVTSAGWILLSDKALDLLTSGHPPTIAQTVKGWSFVTVTAVMLFLLVRRLVAKTVDAQQAFRQEQAARLAALEQAGRELEQRVRERTADLSDANRILQQQIVQRRHVEEALRQAKSTAENANRAKTDFVANISHEIRTPLTSIIGYADLLENAQLIPEERQQYVAILRQNAAHLLQLIGDVLDVSQIEAGQLRIARGACAPATIVMGVLDLLKEQAAEKKIALTLECPAPLPATVHTDATRVRQILLNIVANAIKFTAAGHIRIVARIEPESQMLRLEVHDTGIGMTPEQLEHVFEPFFQVGQTMEKKTGGVGLGLAIARELVERLGGTIAAQSQPGHGSTFIVRVTSTPDFPAAAPASSAAPPVAVRLNGHILLAEDDTHIRRLVALYLQSAGAKVSAAENGRRAVDMARQAAAAGEAIDLALLDMQMPEMNGAETARILRAEGFAGPIIALTAYTLDGERERWISAGCDDMVGKPIDRSTFLQTLGRHLAAARITKS